MSKSDPSSAIFMEDTEQEVNTKIKKAFCPPQIVEGNPCVVYVQKICFPWFGKFDIFRKEDFGGNKWVSFLEGLYGLRHINTWHLFQVKTIKLLLLLQIMSWKNLKSQFQHKDYTSLHFMQ